MTRIEAAAADFANAYRAWATKTGQTFDIESATAFNVMGSLNMARGDAEMVEMDAEDMWKAVRA